MRGINLFIIVLLFWAPLQAGCHGLDDGTGRPSGALLDLLQAYGICHDGSWRTIQEETEKAWLSHGRNTELWEIAPIQDLSPVQTFALFTRLGMTETILASERYYDYGVVLGAALQTVRQRFWFLKTEWERGVRFPMLVILTGDRPLDPSFEGEKELIDPAYSPYPFRPGWHFEGKLPQNETEMMQLVFDQLDLPSVWRQMPVIFVDTPKPEGMRRPHTEHTLLEWLSSNPLPGNLLIVSNQPYICRQDALLRLYLPPPFTMESVGEKLSFETYSKHPKATAVLLAELAYWIKIYAASESASSLFFKSAPCLCER